MRLTLRTLLAYLDDTLEPSQARLIGQKVAESDAAQELIARIRQVTRRRRLMTPPATGPGAKLDPNTIAEYLDNELPAEQLAVVEETCLGSDVHLAEVAACHQILTLVLGEPAMVPPVARQRMYGLIQGREAIPYRKPPVPRAVSPSWDRDSLSADDGDEALQLGLPLQKLGAPWLLPAAAVLLLAASAGALWMALRATPAGPIEVAQAIPPDREVLHFPMEIPDAEPLAKPPAAENTAAVKPDPVTKPDPVPAKADTKPATNGVTVPQPPSDKRVEVGRFDYVDNQPGVILRALKDGATPWQRLAPENKVSTAEYLVCLPGYRGKLKLESKVHLHLWGNLPEFSWLQVLESAVTLHENSVFDLDFTLTRGRVIISNHKSEGAAQVRIRFLDEVWDVTLPDANSVVGIQIVSMYDAEVPFSKEPGGEKPVAQVDLLVLEGQCGLKVQHRQFGALKAPVLFHWESDPRVDARPVPLPRSPDWWTNKTPSAAPFAKEMQAALTALADRLTAKTALEVALTEAQRSKSPASRMLALRCYGALDDLTSLLDALTDEEQDDLRVGAMDVLRGWSGVRPDHDLRLFRLLTSKAISEPHAEIIMKLLHRYARADISSPDTYETLMEYLRHERLPIRELAYFHLRSLASEAAKRIKYHPTMTSDEREVAYEQWKKAIPRGKVPPRPKSEKSGG